MDSHGDSQSLYTRKAQDAITARNALTSPLLRLPAELRSMIWTYVCTDDTYSISTGTGWRKGRYMTFLNPLSPKPCWLGLLHACRQINSEMAPFPVSLNAFRIRGAGVLNVFLDHLARSSNSFTKLKLVDLYLDSCTSGSFDLEERFPQLKLLEVSFYQFMYPWSLRIMELDNIARQRFQDSCAGRVQLVILEPKKNDS